MNVRQFIGMCAKRDAEVIIKDNLDILIAKGTVRDIYMNNNFTFLAEHMTCEKLLESEVYCFFFVNEKLYVDIK